MVTFAHFEGRECERDATRCPRRVCSLRLRVGSDIWGSQVQTNKMSIKIK